MTSSGQFPKVSIITPSYNQAVFLEKTIQSVLGQNYSNLEYIIIDGGSTDGSVDIIKRYAPKLSYWVSQADEGQADAINQGLKRASGEYVAWLNSDDLYLPNCINHILEGFSVNPTAALVFGRVQVINSKGNVISAFRPTPKPTIEDLLVLNTIIPQQAAFFRRSVISEIGDLNQNYHYALDHELFIRVAEKYPIISLSHFCGQYRLSNDNKGVVERSKWASELLQIADTYSRKFSTLNKVFAENIYASAYYHGACRFLDDGNFNEARRWFLQAAQKRTTSLLNIKWWLHFLRTFIGKGGNDLYFKIKLWLAKIGLLNAEYDWWVSLRLNNDSASK